MGNGELVCFTGEFCQSILPLEDVLIAGCLEADGELVGFAAELVHDVLHQAVVLLPAQKLRYRKKAQVKKKLRYRSSGTEAQVQKRRYRSSDTEVRYRSSGGEARVQKLRYRSSDTEAQIQKLRYRSSGTEAQVQKLR
jgi:hypothetical protein